MGIILNKLTKIKAAIKVLPIKIKYFLNITQKKMSFYLETLNLYFFFNLRIEEKAGISPSNGRGAGN